MKKIIFLAAIMVVILASCTNTPEPIDLEATVQSVVSTELAPYKEQMGGYVSSAELQQAQEEQNRQIQQYIGEQIERAKSDFGTAPTEIPLYETNPELFSTSVTATPSDYFSYENTDCLDAFTYVSDITIPDGMIITPNTHFTKTWYVTNSGECTWNSNYNIVYHSGDKVGQSQSYQILKPGYFIKPGESVSISADMIAPDQPNTNFESYWALESDRGERFGSGEAKNVFLSAKFRVENTFSPIQNFGSLTCSDGEGPILCGVMGAESGRGSVYYDDTPMVESRRSQGNPGIVLLPSPGENGGKVRFEFGPLRFPRGSWFYTNFSCRPDTPHCDVQVRLYTREPGYEERLVEEIREWYDGFMGEWKFQLDSRGIFDQEFFYILEVETNGGSDAEDAIMFINTRIY